MKMVSNWENNPLYSLVCSSVLHEIELTQAPLTFCFKLQIGCQASELVTIKRGIQKWRKLWMQLSVFVQDAIDKWTCRWRIIGCMIGSIVVLFESIIDSSMIICRPPNRSVQVPIIIASSTSYVARWYIILCYCHSWRVGWWQHLIKVILLLLMLKFSGGNRIAEEKFSPRKGTSGCDQWSLRFLAGIGLCESAGRRWRWCWWWAGRADLIEEKW